METFEKVSLLDPYGVGTTITFPLTTDANRREVQRHIRKGWTVFRRWVVTVHDDGTRTSRDITDDEEE